MVVQIKNAAGKTGARTERVPHPSSQAAHQWEEKLVLIYVHSLWRKG